ncbi:MAG TPA: hypothetical protein VK932_28490 [Kofleriaceae bacterium]|nr:hypothetical protein [Kofleriaceae bacterium]
MFLQQRGATAVPILTRPFEDVLLRILSYYQSTQPMPHVAIDHPIQNLEPAALADRARQIAAAAIALLEGVA